VNAKIGGIFKKKPNSLEMSAVPGLVSLEIPCKRIAQEGQVSKKVQNFVADKLILITKRTINDLSVIQNYGIR
jgi:hypothetical protein